ncbi:hypothetical protein ADL22_03785 [Streptomyces sp. NRRL F-4489]|uniref:hypothetical protein n=1 Tax=Streptomyces sp. NRRL F-4489 TaxID=1609095 RepID=UPI00074A42D2|nr:hypothetical protein [Streptomyces sp. NRRL F-4489]KUL53441.1 hypothetical protein ADL22_03785 [Streptomyces sp. NRRL F-4489]
MPNPPTTSRDIAFKTVRVSKTAALDVGDTSKIQETKRVTLPSNIARDSSGKAIVAVSLKSWRLQWLEKANLNRVEYPVSEGRVETRILDVQSNTVTVQVTAILATRYLPDAHWRCRFEVSALVTASVEGEGSSDWSEDTDGDAD